MTNMTTLLVTRDPLVVKHVQQVHDERESARLEVCGRLDKVASQLGWNHCLLLVHDAAGVDAEQVRTILTAADRSHVKAAVLRYAASPSQDRPPEFAPYPVYNLPADLPALREVLTSIHREAVRSRPGHTASDAVLDRITATLFGDSNNQITQIRRVAAQETTILLTGETGCGKSMLAKFIHGSSPRRKDPYLVVDCGALSGNLIESEMFGHARGAFTGAERERQGKFAAAGMGTLVLDEINSLPLPLQSKLLRAVEERVFEPLGTNKQESLRARLVAISNVPLEDEVRSAVPSRPLLPLERCRIPPPVSAGAADRDHPACSPTAADQRHGRVPGGDGDLLGCARDADEVSVAGKHSGVAECDRAVGGPCQWTGHPVCRPSGVDPRPVARR